MSDESARQFLTATITLAKTRPPHRWSSEINLNRIQACAQVYYDTCPMAYEAIRRTTRHKGLSKKEPEIHVEMLLRRLQDREILEQHT